MSTILLAEADRDLRDAYLLFLSHHGFQVETADDGLDCVAKLRRSVPDVLILDLELPWGGGAGVLAFLREEQCLLPNRIVLTSTNETSHQFLFLESPAVVKTLPKPFPLSDLLEHAEPGRSIDPKRTSNGSRRPGVLVVDDEPCIRDILARHLQDSNFRVWTAGSGEEALDHCCDHGEEIAVILLDVQMPGLDGPQTLEGIRELNVDLPVCFMTGDPGDYSVSNLLRQGARYLFRKPLCFSEIVDVVRNLASEPMRWPQEN